MSLTVLHSMIAASKLVACILLLVPLVGALAGCDGANYFEEGQFESEAIESLPDGSGMLFIDVSEPGDLGGQLSLLHLATAKRSVMYSANSSIDLRMRQSIWGNFNCDEPEYFSPQSFDLTQRPSGRWQLLVVNHSIIDSFNAADTVEMFELQKNDVQQWELIWRGCVESPVNSFFYVVEALDDGFMLTASLNLQEMIIRFAKKGVGQDIEIVWRWRLQDGFQLVQIDKDTALEKTHSKD
ncbi:MAG: hypothetical protein QMC22_06100 [Pseudomonadales bacterium]